MAEQEKGNYYASLPERKSRMGDSSLCSGDASCAIFKRRLGRLSSIPVEVRWENARIDHI